MSYSPWFAGIALAMGFCGGELPDAVIQLECEDFSGSWREQTNISDYSRRGFVVSNADGIATEQASRH
jgi:hypothetical protein